MLMPIQFQWFNFSDSIANTAVSSSNFLKVYTFFLIFAHRGGNWKMDDHLCGWSLLPPQNGCNRMMILKVVWTNRFFAVFL